MTAGEDVEHAGLLFAFEDLSTGDVEVVEEFAPPPGVLE